MQNLRMIALHQFPRQHLFTALHQEISRYQSKRNHPLQDIDLHGKKEDVLYIGTWKKKIFFKGKFIFLFVWCMESYVAWVSIYNSNFFLIAATWQMKTMTKTVLKDGMSVIKNLGPISHFFLMKTMMNC